MAACLLALMVLIMTKSTLRPGVVVLGCVSVALTFALLENVVCYLPRVDEVGMLKRSYLAVPLHAVMGFLHGLCMERSLRTASLAPLVVAYVATVVFHTMYDVMDSLLVLGLDAVGMGEAIPHLDLPAELVYGPIVFPLLIWMISRWRKVNELDASAWYLEGDGK